MQKKVELIIIVMILASIGLYHLATTETGITGMSVLNPQADIPIGACGNISFPGTYVVTGDLVGAPSCINITSSDVTIDCNGSTITPMGDGSAIFSGEANVGYGLDNITIKNCNISGSGPGNARIGIEIYNVTNLTIIDNNITFDIDDQPTGIRVLDIITANITRNIIDLNSTLSGARGIGIYNFVGIVYNNTIRTFATGGLFSENVGIRDGSDTVSIYENRINVTNPTYNAYGIRFFGPAVNNKYYNNTIWVDGNPGRGFYFPGAWSNKTKILDNEIYVTGRANRSYVSHGISIEGFDVFTQMHDLLIEGNTIQVWNSSIPSNGTDGVIGIEMRRYVDNSTIRNNTIFLETEKGWNTSIGVLVNGSADCTVQHNNINLTGPRPSNIGVRIGSGSVNVNISNNTISTNGTYNNYGIDIGSWGGGFIVEKNTIRTNGNESGNTGIHTTYAATIKENTILPNGQAGFNTGITIHRAGEVSAEDNEITTNGTTGNYGIYLISGGNHSINRNTITTQGTNISHGIYITNSTSNNITNNTITTPGGLAVTLIGEAPGQHGIYLLAGSGQKITGNEIHAGADGIRLERDRTPLVDLLCDNNEITNNKVKAARSGFHSLFCSELTIQENEFYGQERGMLIEGGSIVCEEEAEGGGGCVPGAPCDIPEDCGSPDVPASCWQLGAVFSTSDIKPQAWGICICGDICVNGARCNTNDDCAWGTCFGAVSNPQDNLSTQWAGGTCGDCGGAVSLPESYQPQKATNTSSCTLNTLSENTANSTTGIGTMILGCVQQTINYNKIYGNTGSGLLLADTHDSGLKGNNISSNTSIALRIGGGGTFFDGFEDGTLAPFTTAGDQLWTVEQNPAIAYEGANYTRSLVNDAGDQSNLTLIEAIPSEGGVIQFALFTDFLDGNLKFYVDGDFVKMWDTTFDWEVFSFTVEGGVRTFTWSLNAIGAAGIDAVTTIAEATNNTFNRNNLWTNGTNTWITVGQNSTNNTLRNTTFKEEHGEIRLKDAFTISAPRNVTKRKLNVTENKAFLNSTNLTEFNVSGSIVLLGNVGTLPTVDYEDDGTFVSCNAPQCTNVVTGANSISYDVASFTGYSSNGAGPSPRPQRRTSGGGGGSAVTVIVPETKKEEKTKTVETEPEKKPEPETQKEEATKQVRTPIKQTARAPSRTVTEVRIADAETNPWTIGFYAVSALLVISMGAYAYHRAKKH